MKAKIKLNKYDNTIVKISGSKNSSLPIIAASILCDEEVIINNVPNISDINRMVKIIKKMGYTISFNNNTIITKPTLVSKNKFHYNDIKKIRGSYYLIGALIGKYKHSDFSFAFPGGCNFDNRPINFHLQAFNIMGIKHYTKNNKLYFKGERKNAIHNLEYPSVGTTINIILSSCKIENKTIIHNASIEPEVIDLCNFINSMGANIIINNRTIIIEGKEYLRFTNYQIMSDRIEAATFLTIGALHNGITITNVKYEYISSVISFFKEIGYCFNITNNYITLYKSNKKIKPFNISLNPHPGMPTDIGPILCVLASQINGTSTITDNVYPNRISHINELRKLNIDISIQNNIITINGKNGIINNKVKAHDLRCAAALLIAASLNNTFSYVYNIDKIFRGYEDIQAKLNNIGIDFII